MNPADRVDTKRLLFVARRVFLCVSRSTSAPVDRLHGATVLNFDLGLDGDDVDELLMAVEKYFSIDLTLFAYSRYFHDEGMIGMWPLYAVRGLLARGLSRLVLLVAKVARLPASESVRNGIRNKLEQDLPFRLDTLVWSAYNGYWNPDFSDLSMLKPGLSQWQQRFAERFKNRYKRRRHGGSG